MIRTKKDLCNTRQYKKYSIKDNFIKITKDFCTKWQLEPTLAFIYRIIEDADTLEYGCYTGSKNDLATITYTNPKTAFNALQRLEKMGFIAKVEIYSKTAKKYIVAYKNLGIDCKLPLHKGKPFTPQEKLEINLFQKSKIIEQWQKDFNIQMK